MSKNPLQSKAVLADLTIRLYGARKLDREVTDDTNQRRGAVPDAGRFNKLLLPKAAFERIHTIAGTARVQFRLMTQPWFDEGPRILSHELLETKFAPKLRELKAEFNDAADEFLLQFPAYMEARKSELKTMFKPEDYPAPSTVREKFSLSYVILPFPDASDFRVKLSQDQLTDSKYQMEEALNNAMKEPVRRIIAVVEKMSAKLKGYTPATGVNKAENTFRDSLVGNIKSLVDLLPAFNLINDPKLEELTKRLQTELCVHKAEVLREDDKLRRIVAKNADDILKKAAALMA